MRLCLLLSLLVPFSLSAAVDGKTSAETTLQVEATDEVVIVHFPGKPAEVGFPGIPSWRAEIRRDDAGNITALHVPADHPRTLGSRGFWPLTVLALRNSEGVEGMMSKGRENYVGFPVERFAVLEQTLERVVVEIAGPSKHNFVDHRRTYTFTPKGIAIEGEIVTKVALASVAFDPHWDLTQIADSHVQSIPVRTQEAHGFVPFPISGRDGVTPLPQGVDYPLEAELKLRRDEPTYIRTFWDKPFDSHEGKRLFGHNNKDYHSPTSDRTFYEKLLITAGGPVPRGTRETFKVRYEFETRW